MNNNNESIMMRNYCGAFFGRPIKLKKALACQTPDKAISVRANVFMA